MSDPFGSLWHSWRLIARRVSAHILVPVGVAAAAGIAVSMIVPPHWRAAGLPYLLGYGKNVEAAAIGAALAAGAATQLLAGSRRGLWACAVVAALGFALAAARYPVVPLLACLPGLVATAALVAVAGMAGSYREGATAAWVQTAGPVGGRDLAAAALVAAAVAGLAFAVLAVTVGPPLQTIHVFHHGEILSTAVDLLRGGRPFETLIWPHGLHDTGLAALWIRATGKVGTSPAALAWASCCALGAVGAYVVARRLLGSRSVALAACLALALAPLLLDNPQAGTAAGALDQLGVLVFVAFGFTAVTAPRRCDFAAGLCCGLAYLFRIETGVCASLAAIGVIAWRALAGVEWGGRGERGTGEATGETPALATSQTAALAGARSLGGGVLQFAAGAALVLGGARLIFGWPGSAWFAYTLGDLPRYHRDAVGVPMLWPRRGVAPSPAEAQWLATSLARLLLVLLMMVQALRAVLEHHRGRRERRQSEPLRAAQLLFVALFGALDIRSWLDRSDINHLQQWIALPLFATACLAVAAWRDRRAWGARRTGVAVFVLLFFVDFGWLGFRVPTLRPGSALAGAAREHWRGFLEHLRPNLPVGACADRMFTPGEARIDVNRRFIADECTVEALLRSHGVTRMAIADTGPWYDVRFHLTPVSRFFALARAYTPARQLELIGALRARPAQALLLPRGYDAIRDFDVPDAVRVPVADAYLRGRREGVAVTPTPLGDLFFWNEAPAGPPVARAHTGGERPQVEISVELAAYQPAGGLLFARGRAVEAAERRSPAALAAPDLPPGVVASLEYGLDRGGEVAAGAPRQTDWELFCPGWRGLPGGRPLALAAITAGGQTARLQLDLSGTRLLGPLSGAEWDGLGAAIGRAAALGRADRAAAAAAAGGGQPAAQATAARNSSAARQLPASMW